MADKVVLQNIDAFREALAHYKVSKHAQKVLDESKLVVLTGLTGGGRNTTINYLVEHYDFFFLVSDTTRPPKLRGGDMEKHGVHYYFRTEDEMLEDIRNGEFVEAELIHNQQVSGTSIRELARANQARKVAIHDFEFGGASVIAEAKPDAFIIGLLPPSYDEWIRRLTAREEMHEQEFINRLETAEKVLHQMLSKPYFKFVINDTIKHCADEIYNIVHQNSIDPAHQERAKDVAESLLSEVQKQLVAVKKIK
jgi:guanylate kinase